MKTINKEYPLNLVSAIFGEPDRQKDWNTDQEKGLYFILSLLNEREQKILKYHFEDRMSLRQIGEMYNIQAERTRQIENKALRKLRHPNRLNYFLYGYEGNNKRIDKQESLVIDDKLQFITIQELDFSVRTYNCLKRRGLNTLKDICELTFDELIKTRNFGRKSAEEVIYKIQKLGCELKQEKLGGIK